MDFANNPAMQKKWEVFVRKIDTRTKDYQAVLETIGSFLTRPFVAAVQNEIFTKQWSSAKGKWI